MVRPIQPCLVCGAALHVDEERCVSCGTEMSTDPKTGKRVPRPSSRLLPGWFPTGLFLLVAAWVGGVYGYFWYEGNHSPRAVVAREVARAEQLIGADDGLTAPPEALSEALTIYLAASNEFPEDQDLLARIEQLRERHIDRKLPLAPELQRKLQFLAASLANRVVRDRSILVSGVRDRWNVDALLASPKEMGGWMGGGVVVLTLLYLTLQVLRREAPPDSKAASTSESRPHSRR